MQMKQILICFTKILAPGVDGQDLPSVLINLSTQGDSEKLLTVEKHNISWRFAVDEFCSVLVWSPLCEGCFNLSRKFWLRISHQKKHEAFQLWRLHHY